MKRKVEMKNSLTFILVLLLLGILGFSYAYFQPILSSTGNENLVVSKDLRLMFDDESISEGEIYPGESYSKKFTVTNNGSNTLYYEIKWDNYNNTFTNDEIHIELKCISYINYANESKAVSGTCEGINDKAVTADSLKEGIEIASGKTHEYEVILTFIETGTNQDYNKSKIFNSTLKIIDNSKLTLSLDGGILGQTLKAAYEKGDVIELSNPYKPNYLFISWGVNGRGSSLNGSTLIIGEAPVTLTANYMALSDIYTYTGSSTVIDDGYGNWRIKFLTSGDFTPKIDMIIDVFLVGGGGGGIAATSTCGSGGGGYTNTSVRKSLITNTVYPIVVGNGVTSGQGGTSTAFQASALGGYTGTSTTGGNGGSGGSGTASTSFDGGSDGSYGNGTAGTGQRTTTREFAEATGTLYAGGGGAARSSTVEGAGGAGGGGTGGKVGSINSQSGTPNTGGGGGSQVSGTTGGGKSGGSGIVIIRNTKINVVGETSKFMFAYSGTYEIVNGTTDSWKIKFLTSGVFIPLTTMNIDVFLVGGGGAGTAASSTCGGGGGGYTGLTTASLTEGTSYTITVGLGARSGQGGTTTAFSTSVLGGYSGGTSTGGNGGSGGAGTASASFTGGSNGSNGTGNAGTGQGTTTREFGEITGDLYAGGGGATRATGEGYGGSGGGGTGGLNLSTTPQPGTPNTGGGGGAQVSANATGGGKPGGSGVVVIRKH